MTCAFLLYSGELSELNHKAPHFLSEAEFKEFVPRRELETRLNYGWFHLKLYSMLQDLSRRSIETGLRRI